MNRQLANRIALTLGVLFVIAITALSAFGQAGTSSLTGTVRDPQNHAVAGANVTLKNDEKNFSRTQVSDGNGSYKFSSVPPDTYVLEVESTGFKKAVVSSVKVLADNAARVDVALEVGNVKEIVNVTSGGIETLVNTQDASLGNNFVSQQILQLPLENRNVGNLLSLQPGVTPDGYVAGGRSDQANLTLDGVDVNEQQTGDAFTPVLRVSPDTVEEFRVITTNANATYGRSSGAQVSFITKGGTNQFHGAAYWYHRNTVTTANDFFSNAAGSFGPNDSAVLSGTAKVGDPRVPRPKLLRNVFGGSLGGPVVKNRLFFFYNYEGRRDAKQDAITRIVPLAGLGRGEVSFIARRPGDPATGGVPVTLTAAQVNNLLLGGLPVVDVNPIATGILAGAASRYSANDLLTTGDGRNTGGFRFNAPLPVKLNAHTARFDWNLTKDGRHLIFARGNYQHDLTANLPYFPDTPVPSTWSHPLGFVVGHTWTLNSRQTNNFRYGLTREAFSDQGESAENDIRFRTVYFAERLFTRTFSRVTPVTNFTDDFLWIKGSHTLQFGTNIRLVRNERVSFASSFDNGLANQSFYQASGAVLSNAINQSLPALTGLPAGTVIRADWVTPARTALTAVIGRLSQYTANFNFGVDGKPLAQGVGITRTFATEEYDVYGQDSWKIKQTMTLNLGLRYGLSRPVYETQGFQTRPNIGLSEYLERRIAASQAGTNFTDPITVDLAGPFYKKPGFYPWDKNNFQPRVSLAWSPNFRKGLLGRLFGADGDSVLRGGFAITNDYFGQALAVNFNANNTLGFSSATTPSANTYNITTRPAPLITGLGQSIRTLPGITVPGNLVFPQTQPQDFARRIEGSLDSNLVSPINYSWNFTFGRKLPKGMYVEASYIGRLARNLLATRDVMALNNIVDPKSGQDWYSAASALEVLRRNGASIASVPNQPWFENMYPAGTIDGIFFGAGLNNTQAAFAVMAIDNPGCAGLGGCGEFGTDWTFLQDLLDAFSGKELFFQSQYGALSAYSTIASSDYHGGTVSLRQRHRGLSWDLNYTLSKSIDDASGLQTSGVFGAAFILNPLRQRDNRAVSNFDVRHIVNFNSIWEIPMGRGRWLFNNTNPVVNGIIGGWQLTSVFRWNSGYPVEDFFDVGGWPTNWNVRSNVIRIKAIESSPTRGGNGKAPNLFADPSAAYQSFRSPGPGETGERNILRYPGYVSLDLGLYKSFSMPWSEKHKLQIRWEVFNVTNTQRLTGPIADPTFGVDPQNGTPGPTFGNLTEIQGNPRIMQFAIRYDF